MNRMVYEEVIAVKRLGERIGYGNMMHIASALWDRDLRDMFHGEHVEGYFVPTLPSWVHPEHLEEVKKEHLADHQMVLNTLYDKATTGRP